MELSKVQKDELQKLCDRLGEGVSLILLSLVFGIWHSHNIAGRVTLVTAKHTQTVQEMQGISLLHDLLLVLVESSVHGSMFIFYCTF